MLSESLINTSQNLPVNPSLKCGETLVDDDDILYDDEDEYCFPINFHVTLPEEYGEMKLRFGSRDKCSGVLLPSEEKVYKEDLESGGLNDPFFFQPGFYLEAKTGFQVWPGSRLMAESFICTTDNDAMKDYQKNLNGLRILEVGSGIGFAGTLLASCGASVLLSDLPVLVEHGISSNIRRNAKIEKSTILPPKAENFFGDIESTNIGKGWASAAVLDWFKPASDQLQSQTLSSIDVIIGCDCMFIRKIVEPLLNTVSTIFEQSAGNNPKFLFTFQHRNMRGVFTQFEELLNLIQDRGWEMKCVAWRRIAVEDDGEQNLYLFEVTPS